MQSFMQKRAAQMSRLESQLIKKRGEAIHRLTEIEWTLDQIITRSFIKSEYQGKFQLILLWEDFRLSTKVRLFKEVLVPQELETTQRRIINDLEKRLLPVRNKYAHRSGVIYAERGGGIAFLLDKGLKPFVISEKDFKEFRKTCKHVLNMLDEIISALDAGVSQADRIGASLVRH